MAAPFATDTAVKPLGDGRYGATIVPSWRVERPNGGYVAALVLRAVTAVSVANGAAIGGEGNGAGRHPDPSAG